MPDMRPPRPDAAPTDARPADPSSSAASPTDARPSNAARQDTTPADASTSDTNSSAAPTPSSALSDVSPHGTTPADTPPPDTPQPILTASGVTAGYVPDLPILRDVSIAVAPASVTVIIGPNGAGKSTLIKAIAGLVPVSAGQVRHDGRDITNIAPHALADEAMAYVPQTDNIFRSLTIEENLALALRRAGKARKARLERLYETFPPLAAKRGEKAGALSGGQRQFLAVANALAVEPRLILMDEPSAGLSPLAAQEVLGMARDLTRQGVTILLVEQNVTQALKLADHCYILAEGRNQVDGKAADLLGNQVVADIYLGGKRVRAGA